ncbi:hypothetical protein [Nitrosomonas communis]|uniref:Uncharacterized protein n=1 Tax=Nitrosomonas communis TaxID=44574 RepID=A0A1I4LQV5_9PROT|nr:hypothetical protein [Nitrosomonas communis]SFL93390.1 hypothetical protein SAMN05421863_100754 [Nitrosomonas communis]
MMATLSAYPSQVHADATALLVYQGQPNRTVNWNLVGSGSVTPLSNCTDETGKAGALYQPGTAGGTVKVEVTAGA